MLALLALVASVLIWAAPSSQAQAGNQAPFADAGPDQTLNPSDPATLDGTGSLDVDDDGTSNPIAGCGGCEFEWEIQTGPYDWITITNAKSADTATFDVPSAAFVDKVSDSDPQKYEIVVRLTVTDDDGATDSDTVTIKINQRPVADIQLYAGLRDMTITDADLGVRGHFPDDAVIDGPGENGNRDNEWDIMEGAYLQLDGSGSTDEGISGQPATYWWTRPQLRGATAGYADAQASPGTATQQRLDVAVDNLLTGDESNVVTITFVGVDENGDNSDDTLVVETLPDVAPNAPVTVIYQLNVCDAVNDAGNACTGQTGSSLIRIVVHDTSVAPEVEIEAGLTTASDGRGDAEPQSTVSQFTGVENQFIVAAGSTVLLTATVKDLDQPSVDDAGTPADPSDDSLTHTYRWSGATAVAATATATVRVPADAADGDTLDVSVTVTDNSRNSMTTDIQLLIGENTPPTAGGVPANQGSINNPDPTSDSFGDAILYVHSITDGFQNLRDGSTVTLRGVANDADGGSPFTAWALREGPDHAALHTAIETWMTAIGNIDTTADAATQAGLKAQADGAALATVGAALTDMQEPQKPLLELNGALTDTVSFDVPNLENTINAGTLLLFNAIDSNGVAAAQIIYVHISADDDSPNADAGPDEQVDPGAFVRLNGSASADPDVGDTITYSGNSPARPWIRLQISAPRCLPPRSMRSTAGSWIRPTTASSPTS